MEKMSIEPIVMNNKFNKIFIHPIIGNFNETTGRGWFAVSLKDYENQPLENKIFSEEWDIVDATYPGEKHYYTWLKISYFGDKVPVKVTYSNGTHRWKPMGELLALIKDKTFGNNYSFRITEMRIRPYRYTDDYGHNRIAGQLQFVGVESDETYYPRFVSDQLPDEIDKIDIPEDVEKAVSENPTVSSFDFEHDKPKSGKDEPESVIYYDNVPTITNKVDVDTTKPLTGEDKHLNDMIVKYWLLNNLIGMYNDADANIRHPNANELAKMVIKDIKNTYIDDEQANEIWNKYIKEDK